MFNQLTDLGKAVIYYGITFILTLLYVLLLPADGTGLDFVMFVPLLGVLIILLVVTRDGYSATGWADLGLHRLGFRGWGLALLTPLPILLLSYAIVWSLGIASLNLSTVGSSPVEFAFNLLVDGLVFSVLFALGEEIGWRGYLLPRLLTLGPIRAMLLSGLLHAVWHFPIIFLTPFYHGEGNRLIVIPLFLLTLTVGGILYGYLRLTTNSIWPVALFHGAWNTLSGILRTVSVASTPLVTEYLGGESGLLTLLSAIIVSAWLLYLLKKRPQPVASAI
jgi:membrane protease YdiL (CAAX protease family)